MSISNYNMNKVIISQTKTLCLGLLPDERNLLKTQIPIHQHFRNKVRKHGKIIGLINHVKTLVNMSEWACQKIYYIWVYTHVNYQSVYKYTSSKVWSKNWRIGPWETARKQSTRRGLSDEAPNLISVHRYTSSKVRSKVQRSWGGEKWSVWVTTSKAKFIELNDHVK